MRRATDKDKEFVRGVKNSSLVFSFSPKYVTKKMHDKWWKKGHLIYIIDKAGYLRLDDYISIAILPEHRNKGLGTKILKKIYGKALIGIENRRSIHVFKKCGFKVKALLMEKVHKLNGGE